MSRAKKQRRRGRLFVYLPGLILLLGHGCQIGSAFANARESQSRKLNARLSPSGRYVYRDEQGRAGKSDRSLGSILSQDDGHRSRGRQVSSSSLRWADEMSCILDDVRVRRLSCVLQGRSPAWAMRVGRGRLKHLCLTLFALTWISALCFVAGR